MPKQPVGFTSKQETAAVFVRVPLDEADKLDRLAFELKRPKREIVTALLSAVDLEEGRVVLGRVDLRPERRDTGGDVLTLEELARLLEVEAAAVQELAEGGELPGRKIAGSWRFSRRAILAWLACV